MITIHGDTKTGVALQLINQPLRAEVENNYNAENEIITIGQILFIGEHQDDSIFHFAVVDYSMELLARLVNTVTIGAVHDKN